MLTGWSDWTRSRSISMISAVADAGIVLAASLAERLGIQALVDETVDFGQRPGAANAGAKVMTLVPAMALGADCIDDSDLLRAGAAGWFSTIASRHPRRWGRSYGTTSRQGGPAGSVILAYALGAPQAVRHRRKNFASRARARAR
jgi:hypothetical protein